MKSSIILILLVFASVICGQNSLGKETGSRKEAERIWELAIQAKGGHEKLNAIRNIQISTRGWPRTEFLIVYPNKLWSWEDYLPSVLGLHMSMYNLETGKNISWNEVTKKLI